MSDLNAKLERLAKCPPPELRQQWREVMRMPAPDIGPDLMRRAIAYRLQERQHSKLSRSTLKMIEKLGRQLERSGKSSTSARTLMAGTRLTRSWHGKMHQVLVCEEGFEFEGRHYKSLSQIAKAITGAHWSGPRFFGLAKRS